ncbi:MAG: IPT/TIG domain-containing protein, partial [Phycisphaeraceae bacterium]|nr:IPT/TIG domain-containing protein [Phycisphaeraceae bacterium]
TIVIFANNTTTGSFSGTSNGGRQGAGATGGSGGSPGKGGSGSSGGGAGSAGVSGAIGANGADGIEGSIVVKKANPISFSSISPSSGPKAGGTTITIKGGNFIGNDHGWIGTSAKIGTVSVINLTWVSETEMTGTTPAEPAGVYNVMGGNPDGSKAVMSMKFTFT